MSLYQLGDKRPQIDASAWIAPNATLIGDARIGAEVSIWWNTVIRADNHPIIVGDRCNIQDSSVLHTDVGVVLTLEQGVTIGHRVLLHGCHVGEFSMIGMGSVLMNHARIGRQCLVGANTLISEGKEFPDQVLILGSPGKVVRPLSEAEVAMVTGSADHYVANRQRYLTTLKPL
jgi:carbonic anhydrase/acetyltransferase-like protein (isoleucine patch superfamily)